jgi:hypothetical protein
LPGEIKSRNIGMLIFEDIDAHMGDAGDGGKV